MIYGGDFSKQFNIAVKSLGSLLAKWIFKVTFPSCKCVYSSKESSVGHGKAWELSQV